MKRILSSEKELLGWWIDATKDMWPVEEDTPNEMPASYPCAVVWSRGSDDSAKDWIEFEYVYPSDFVSSEDILSSGVV